MVLMIKKTKGIEIVEIFFITHLSAFDSIVLLTIKIMAFDDVA
jgi:hypothetical protein